jgi:type IV pilus assembly protein PilY1
MSTRRFSSHSFNRRIALPLISALVLQGALAPLAAHAAGPAQMDISNSPVLGISGGTPNVLLVLDNSNSMDRTADGAPVLATDSTSKSAIARAAARKIIANYGSTMNIGLMAYQQTQVQKMHAFRVYSDISFNSSNKTSANPRESTHAQLFSSPTGTVYPNNFYYTKALMQESYMFPYYYDPKSYYFYWPGDSNAWYYLLSGRQRSDDQLLNLYNTSVNYACRGPAPSYAPFTWPPGNYAPQGWVNPNANNTSTYKIDWQGLYCTQFIDPDSSAHGVNVGKYGKWAAAEYLNGSVWWSEQLTKDASYGFLHVPIGLARPGSQQLSDLNTKLKNEETNYGTEGVTFTSATSNVSYKNISDSDGWKNPAKPLENAGSTPMEGTLQTANTYFTSGLAAGAQSAKTAAKPQASACTKNFVIFLTDGLPSTKAGGNATTPTPAQLKQGVITAAGQLLKNNISTYFIGFGSEAAGNADLNAFAQSGGTGAALSAMDEASLNAALDSIFQNIVATSAAGAALAANSTSLSSTSMIYQAMYDADWSGHLRAYKIDMISDKPEWDAAAQIPTPYTSRKIYTYVPSTKNGLYLDFSSAFSTTWNSLDASQKTALATNNATGNSSYYDGQLMLRYLAGDKTREGTGGTPPNSFRARKSLLGDIINSGPVYVARPVMGYPNNYEPASLLDKKPYSQFVTDQASRTPMLYVGANDGMLHGFGASDGKERFAYIPAAVFPRLSDLAATPYVHRFYVDGPPTVSDAYFGSNGSSGSWHTVLVGGLNAGGQGIYALDVTDPVNFGAGSVLWEFGDRQTSAAPGSAPNYDADLGYTFSAPSIARVRAATPSGGHWVAIFGNGYGNTQADGSASGTGNAVLYVVDLKNGQLIKKFDTGYGWAQDPTGANKPNGLSTPAPADVDGEGNVEYVYAGDLQGHLWKFDLSDADANHWKIAFDGAPLFTATDPNGKAQPITAEPEVSPGPSHQGGQMVYFGTGKNFETGDAMSTTNPKNTFYGIWDNHSSAVTDTPNKSALVQQTISTAKDARGIDWRLVTSSTVDWTKQRGWYMDLPTQYEKSLSSPQFYDGRIIFVTVSPAVSTDSCSASGISWLMIIDAMTGSALDVSPFDVNGDGAFNSEDTVDDGSGRKRPPAGASVRDLVSRPWFIRVPLVPGGCPEGTTMNADGTCESGCPNGTIKNANGQCEPPPGGCPPGSREALFNTSTGGLEKKCVSDNMSSRRLSWRDLSLSN